MSLASVTTSKSGSLSRSSRRPAAHDLVIVGKNDPDHLRRGRLALRGIVALGVFLVAHAFEGNACSRDPPA
jgi:hypothetical protein